MYAVTEFVCFLTMFAMNLTGFFSHCCEGFQHMVIFEPFEVKLESSVFWLVGSFQAKGKGHRQQAEITSNVCSGKTSCSSTVHS